MSVYIQMGYGKGDKVEQAIKNNSIQGIILSPRDERKDALESFLQKLSIQNSNIDIIFDPQLYYSTFSDAVTKNLVYHDYFPGIVNQGFFNYKNITSIVNQCLDYQKNIGLKKLVGPNILIYNFNSREAQIALNFADQISQIAKEYQEKVLVSLIIHESAFNDINSLNAYLNDLTRFDTDGFYIIINRNHTSYDQYFEPHETIKNLMYTVYSLSLINGYEIIMGYTDLLGVLFKPFNISGLGTGWYLSSRKFTVQQKILPSKGGRLPRERYTAIKLLNSLYLSELDNIAGQFGTNSDEFKAVLSNTVYDHLLIQGKQPSSQWNRTIGQLQHWCALNNLYSEFDAIKSTTEKLVLLEEKIETANKIYKHLKDNFIHFESSSSNRHLDNWSKALRSFRKEFHI